MQHRCTVLVNSISVVRWPFHAVLCTRSSLIRVACLSKKCAEDSILLSHANVQLLLVRRPSVARGRRVSSLSLFAWSLPLPWPYCSQRWTIVCPLRC